ncbi:MAG: undecaprenyl-diphosphatase UppP [Candidatus Sumerlaeaceae bacterium]|nr:undecaprenyl-diphosphatase UppP [Candidatus Sumerlaeaceae bacterium]
MTPSGLAGPEKSVAFEARRRDSKARYRYHCKEQPLITTWQAVALGTVQGLTEFLPVSSSAHLKLMPWLFQWPDVENEMAFDVALHLGTLLAIVLFFFTDWLMIVASYIGDLRMKKWKGGAKGSLLPKIIIATIPAAVIGKLFEKKIEAFFYGDNSNIWMLAVTLSVFGLLLLIAEKVGKNSRDLADIGYAMALTIGCAQALALIPGTSRSGVTIFAGLLFGLTRPAAARFSFLMATPITAGAVLLKIKDLRGIEDYTPIIIGILVSAIVGILAIKVLLKYVQTRSYAVFAFYRWILAAVVLWFYFQRVHA